MRYALLLAGLLLPAALLVCGYPQGAPGEVCQTMIPNRKAHGLSQRLSTFPYNVTCKMTAIDVITVRVQGRKGLKFKGLLVQVRDGNSAIGTVMPTNKKDYQAVCSKGAATHTSKKNKSVAEFRVVVKPGQINRNIQCRVTVVRNRTTFWANHVTPIALPVSRPPNRGVKKMPKKSPPRRPLPRKNRKKPKKSKKGKKRSRRSAEAQAERLRRSANQPALRTRRSALNSAKKTKRAVPKIYKRK